MTKECKISELRRQLEEMETLSSQFDEHCHVDSVTPEEKVIIERTKAKCIEAVRTRMIPDNPKFDITQCEIDAHNDGINESIEAITDVE